MVALTAVILAAGVNRRLGRTPVPKSLLPLTRNGPGPSFLERHVAILRELGVGEVRVVLSEPARGSCPTFDGMRIVVNTFDTSETGSTLSMLCALRGPTTPADHGLLIMDADIVYERALMRWVIDHCDASSCLFTAPATAGDDEEVRVYGVDSGDPRFIGKGLTREMTRGMIPARRESRRHPRRTARSGFPAGHERMAGGMGARAKGLRLLEGAIGTRRGVAVLLRCRRMRVAQVPAGLLYTECDTPDDYDFVRDELYPAILAHDSKQP
jgi:choline kinase